MIFHKSPLSNLFVKIPYFLSYYPKKLLNNKNVIVSKFYESMFFGSVDHDSNNYDVSINDIDQRKEQLLSKLRLSLQKSLNETLQSNNDLSGKWKKKYKIIKHQKLKEGWLFLNRDDYDFNTNFIKKYSKNKEKNPLTHCNDDIIIDDDNIHTKHPWDGKSKSRPFGYTLLELLSNDSDYIVPGRNLISSFSTEKSQLFSSHLENNKTILKKTEKKTHNTINRMSSDVIKYEHVSLLELLNENYCKKGKHIIYSSGNFSQDALIEKPSYPNVTTKKYSEEGVSVEISHKEKENQSTISGTFQKLSTNNILLQTLTLHSIQPMYMPTIKQPHLILNKHQVQLSTIKELLHTSRNGAIEPLSTNECNLCLLSLCVGIIDGAVIRNIQEVLEIMLDNKGNIGKPNGDTLSIIIDALTTCNYSPSLRKSLCIGILKRLGMFSNSISEKIRSQSNIDIRMIDITMRILMENNHDIESAEKLWSWCINNNKQSIIGIGAVKSLIIIYQNHNESRKAIDLVKFICLNNGNTVRFHRNSIQKVYSWIIHWPKYINGKKIPLSKHYEDVYTNLLYDSPERPTLQVWRILLCKSINVARDYSEKWFFVKKILLEIINHPSISSKEWVSKFVLEAAEELNDAKLSFQLLDIIMPDDENQDLPKSISQVMIRTMKLCLNTKNLNLAELIVSKTLKDDRISRGLLIDATTLLLLTLPKNPTKVFTELISSIHGCVPKTQTYAAYIHALVNNEQHEEALSILNSLLEGRNKSKSSDTNTTMTLPPPNVDCFTACMISAMKKNKWTQILSLHDTMIAQNIHPNSTSVHGLMLASHRLGGNKQLINVIQKALNDQVPINEQLFLSSWKLLFPQYNEVNNVVSIRNLLRQLAEYYSDEIHNKNTILCLIKVLRTAQLEDMSKSNPKKDQLQLQNREQRWRKVMRKLLKVYRVLNDINVIQEKNIQPNN